ncbi:MAG: L-histidine N(alpha)-methyltransferase, partial [Betaproteobacteria bacterium]|nr:L-histidine N(alpha)-methyltransferase [Betaproteobacteria bacterium]
MGPAGEGDRRPHRARDRPPSRLSHRRRLVPFRQDVLAGLGLPQKALPPKYFYDARGSRLFERICRLPEYYLTRAELALTRANLQAIARFAGRDAQLVEYGSGESLKSRLLIRVMRPSAYLPVDISASALE